MTTTTNLKGYLLSTGITFITVFATIFFGAIQVTSFALNKTSLIALASAAVISAIRAVAKLITELIAGVATNPVATPVVSTPTSTTTVV